MRIFIAGATGAVGKRLVPLLTKAGHSVTATTTRRAKVEGLRSMGADAVVADLLDKDRITSAVMAARPDVVVHQASGLASMRSLKHFDDEFRTTNRLRTEGTETLIAAARLAGASRFVAQSYTGWPNERAGGRLKTEADRLDPNPPKNMTKTLNAIRKLEEMVTSSSDLVGAVLRYGSFYGQGTSLAPGGELFEAVRRRSLPIVGKGCGVWSWIHIDDVAHATKCAIEQDVSGVFNIVDDEPAEVSIWLPYLAEAIGAKPPFHVPEWIGRIAVGESGVSMMTKIRGSSNAKVKCVLGWKPIYPSWREGFQGLANAK